MMAELHRWLEAQLAEKKAEGIELRLRTGNHLSVTALARVDGLPARSERSPG